MTALLQLLLLLTILGPRLCPALDVAATPDLWRRSVDCLDDLMQTMHKGNTHYNDFKFLASGTFGKVYDVNDTSTSAGSFYDLSAVDIDGNHISLLHDRIALLHQGNTSTNDSDQF